MKDMLKSILMGIGAAAGFFLAIHFTADAELDAEAEQQAFLQGVMYGAKEATLNKQCGWRDVYRSPM